VLLLIKFVHVQAAARKRSRRHMLETDEFVAGNSEGIKMDLVYFTTAYQKMKSLCHNLRNEIFTDIEIHNHHILPRYFVVSGPDVHFFNTVLCTIYDNHPL
jgi:hypothetical protein